MALTAQQAAGSVPQAAATLTRPERATAAATRWATPISLRARTESRKSRHNIGASSRFNIRNAPSRAGRFPLNKVRDPEARPALTKGHGVELQLRCRLPSGGQTSFRTWTSKPRCILPHKLLEPRSALALPRRSISFKSMGCAGGAGGVGATV